jgi:hypothetical protein
MRPPVALAATVYVPGLSVATTCVDDAQPASAPPIASAARATRAQSRSLFNMMYLSLLIVASADGVVTDRLDGFSANRIIRNLPLEISLMDRKHCCLRLNNPRAFFDRRLDALARADCLKHFPKRGRATSL